MAAAPSRELGLAFAPEDLAVTAGAFAAIARAVRLVMEEVVIPVPGLFC